MIGRRECEDIGCGEIYPHYLTECPKCGSPDWSARVIPYDCSHWIYDLESYPNLFVAGFRHARTGMRRRFVLSDQQNDAQELLDYLFGLIDNRYKLVGYNNVGYDYPMIHWFVENYFPGINAGHMFTQNERIIRTPWERRFDNIVAPWLVRIPQIDLYLIHHFDNDAKRTSLKLLEFNMRSEDIQGLPYPPGTTLTPEQAAKVVSYNDNDIDETFYFYAETIDMIEFREKFSEKFGKDFTNHNNGKIGKTILVDRLEELNPGSCYMEVGGKRHPRQTVRPQIRLVDAVFPYIKFEHPEFERIRKWFIEQTITETKGVFKDLTATIDGFTYVLGVGGIHGSVESQTVESDDHYVIYDWDVASYYPNLAIKNRYYPEHLNETFCDVLQSIFEERRQYAKKTVENRALKEALNVPYGQSNMKHGPFYDPLYTMTTTINGQLLLCMLAEQLIKIPNAQMIQINTDGLTIRVPRQYVDHMKSVCQWWENFTCLTLESEIYSRMFIRDVNNYIGEFENGKLKRKGAYRLRDDLEWHQNHGGLIVPIAAQNYLVKGIPVEKTIREHKDIFDFCYRAKVGSKDQLIFEQGGSQIELQRITRYYVSTDGGVLSKIAPPVQGAQPGQWKRANGLTNGFYSQVINELKNAAPYPPDTILDSIGLPWDERINTKNKSTYEIRSTSIEAGRLVTPCNDIIDSSLRNVDYDYYINEAKKLTEILR